MKRRAWLLAGAGAAGALVLGWSILPQRSRLGAPALWRVGAGEVALNGWIKVLADGGVVLAMPRSEMGQGVHTALCMLAAEELDLPLERVQVEQAGADAIYGNVAMLLASLPFHPLEAELAEHAGGFGRVKASRWVVGKVVRELGINATGGSSSVADAWEVVRLAAATARASLVGAASLAWKLPVSELRVERGVVSHASGPSAHFGELARFAAGTPPGPVRLKSRQAWTVIGKSLPRPDLAGKVDGTATFGIDVRLPGMRFAALRLCPVLGGSPGRLDASAALAAPGVDRLVMLPAYAGSTAGFAVVARTWWEAEQAAERVEVDWMPPPAGVAETTQFAASLRRAVESQEGFVFHDAGDTVAAEGAGARVVESWYSAPYLAHMTLEPMNCTAQVVDGQVKLWAPTQVPQMCREVAARVAGLPDERVQVYVTLLGGGFGRRLEVDYAALAVRVAMDTGGAPVQLTWSREQDTRHDYYRPMQVARLRGTLDAQGRLLALNIKSAGDAISPRWLERTLPALTGPIDLPDKTTSEGLFDLAYGVPSFRAEHVATRSGVPVGFWRSVGHSHNAFFSESFIEELAVAAGVDPLEFRRSMLKGRDRHVAVLTLAAEKAGWGRTLPPGWAAGIALHESFGSVVAQVAELSLGPGGVQVHRVVCAIDCGTVVNPGIVAQQMEGSVIFALTAALHGQIDIVGGAVQQGNFNDAPMVRLPTAPQVETWLVSSERPPSGVGEPGVPPLAAAVGNALFRLTGVRQRSLPLQA